ncbi:MAG: hypothetical protein J2P13_11600 [Acidobacteria bacterium]|nr:hypothetical protein [Acidobacteriota bacterium]
MPSIAVTNLESFRIWRDSETLPLDWLIERLRYDQPETELMKASKALHKAFELAEEMEVATLAAGDFRFDFNCDCELIIPDSREFKVSKDYLGVDVRGRVDGRIGDALTDYKVTERFDGDSCEHLMQSYQWRLYCDMTGAKTFIYQILVVSDFGPPNCYSVRETHTLKTYAYPELHEDCERLVEDYKATILGHPASALLVNEERKAA